MFPFFFFPGSLFQEKEENRGGEFVDNNGRKGLHNKIVVLGTEEPLFFLDLAQVLMRGGAVSPARISIFSTLVCMITYMIL